jgi:hypothetical protein
MTRSPGYVFGGAVLMAVLVWFPIRAEVIFERKVAPEVIERHEIKINNYRPGPLTPEELQAKIERAKSNAQGNPGILKVELLRDSVNGNPYFKMTSLGLDKVKAAASQAWFDEARKRYGVEGNIGKVQPDGSFGGGLMQSHYHFFDGLDDFGNFSQHFRGPDGLRVVVYFYEVPDREVDLHQFLRILIGEDDCDLEKRSFGYVVETEKKVAESGRGTRRVRFSWLHGPRLQILISALGDLPADFVEAYGKRFPSSLPKDLEIDKTAWGREEARFWLRRLERSLDDPGAGNRGDRFITDLHRFREYIFVPELQVTLPSEFTREDKKTVFDGLSKWWQEHGEKTYWEKSIQQLVAEGLSPKDLERQAKEKEEARIEAILSAPIDESKLEELKKRAIERLEKDNSEEVKRSNRDLPEGEWNAKFEKVGDGFVFTRKDKDGSLTQWTFSGPEIRKRLFNRRKPLQAVFTQSVYDRIQKKTTRSEHTYTYDKLEDRWGRS